MKLMSAIGTATSKIRARIKAHDIKVHPVTKLTVVVQEEQRQIREQWAQALKIRVHHSQHCIDATNKEFYIRATESNTLIARMQAVYPELPWPALLDADVVQDEIMRVTSPKITAKAWVDVPVAAATANGKPQGKPATTRAASATPINAKGQGA